ncbi:hypothetical protein ASD11_02520 [Aeromicrobium sp. Root495]|uniref:spermidine synthase n=1 Tax=Aeromicrobium sp. Root495 TaxID=1736550 RepID=UPI0006F37DDD|nr:methyltransferase [Aeromicrobium sp. Root495]KQY58554.1 hypothetical protein ASD11_02520 [Aeromicrobium sp. Root495]
MTEGPAPETDPVHLRRRADGALELRVNGVFVMDDVETTSERLLATHVLDQGAREVLVGGLGLGFTAAEMLAQGARRVVVAELHRTVVAAVQDGHGAGPLDDDRIEIVVGDVRDVVAAQDPQSLDAICLDVDNGPDHLVHQHNAELYQPDFLHVCAERLRPGGHLVVWSWADSKELRRDLRTHFEKVTSIRVPVLLGNRESDYWLISGRKP